MSQLLYNNVFEGNNLPSTIDEAVTTGINSDSLQNYFFVVPTGKIVKHLERRILFEYYERTGKPLPKLNVFTLQDFAKYCFKKLFNAKDYHIVSEAYRLALFEEAVSRANLEFFKGKNEKISYALLERLSELINGLKEDGITEKEIAANLNASNKQGNVLAVDVSRLSDIYNLYMEYQDILGDKYLDDTELLIKTTGSLSTRNFDFSQIVSDVDLIIFEGFSEFKKPELDFITVFSHCTVPLLINIDYDDIQGPLYTILEDSIKKLIDAGFAVKNHNVQHSGKLLNHLKHNLFGYSFNKLNDFSPLIKIIESPSRIEEVILIARLVKFLILKKDIQPSEICIALRQPEKYSPLFREVFYTHKIPANVMERFELASSPVITGIISALNITINGFRRDDLIKFLKNPFLSVVADDSIDVDNIISLTIDLRITGGMKRGGIDGIINILNRTLDYYYEKVKFLVDTPDTEPYEIITAKEFVKNTQKCIRDLSKIRDTLLLPSKKLSPAQFRDYIFQNLVMNLNVVENIKKHLIIAKQRDNTKSDIEKNNIIEEVEKNSKALNKLYDLLNEMVYVLSDRFPKREFTLNELMERLKIAIYGSKYQIAEKIGYGVTVTTIEQTRQIPYKVMVLAGAIDGEFPTPYSPETFLGMKLESSEIRHILSERMQFFQFMTNAPEMLETGEKQIYISYPKFTEERELVRSPFVDALLKITSLEEDKCIIDYSIVKSAIINNYFDRQVSSLIDEHRWLFSVASNIDVQTSYAGAIAGNGKLENKTFDSISIRVKKNIQAYLKFIENENTSSIRIDKSSLPEEVKQKFESLAQKPFSVTELENYAKCPYFYFLKNLLRLETKEELELGMTALEIGNILHKIVYEFFQTLSSSELERNSTNRFDLGINNRLPALVPISLAPSLKTDYLELLQSITNSLLDDIAFDYPLFNIDREVILGNERQSGIIEIWLRNELKRQADGWDTAPVLFEFGFGMETLNAFNVPVVDFGGLKLRGKIDRVEKIHNANEFIIADYKLSTKIIASNKLVDNGKIFQMPLYMLAMEKIVADEYGLSEWKAGGAVYYFFKTKFNEDKQYIEEYKQLLVPQDSAVSKFIGKDKSKPSIKNEEQLRLYLDNNLNAARTIVDKIANGIFDIKPDKTACTYCKFNSICRFTS